MIIQICCEYVFAKNSNTQKRKSKQTNSKLQQIYLNYTKKGDSNYKYCTIDSVAQSIYNELTKSYSENLVNYIHGNH